MSSTNYGFIEPKLSSDQKIFGALGSLPKEVIREDGQWDDFLPQYEIQNENGYEPYACTVYGEQNQEEIYLKALTGIEHNFDERFLYILADIVPPGTDPSKVYSVRKTWGQTEGELSNNVPTLEEYRNPNPLPNRILEIGLKWKEKWDFDFEWLFVNETRKDYRIAILKECLKYAPIAVSVTAWYEEDGIYIDKRLPNNHWCVCYGYIDKEITVNGQKKTETFWKIFDSYDHTIKILHPDHEMAYAKRIYLKKKVEPKKQSFWLTLIQALRALLWLRRIKA